MDRKKLKDLINNNEKAQRQSGRSGQTRELFEEDM